jgi:hypothetical protein
MRRRDLFVAGAALALARPAAAGASEGDVLDGLVSRQDAAAFAYDAAGMAAAARLATDHARALRTQVDALGRRIPVPPARIDQLDRPARRVAQGGSPADVIALQQSLLEAYERALGEIVEPSILRTAATIAASHAQHLALLRREAGLDPLS